jgi:hypothetical protein
MIFAPYDSTDISALKNEKCPSNKEITENSEKNCSY